MFEIDNFIEIQVVGFLLLFAISPLLNLLSPAFRAKEGFCPLLEDISHKSAKAVLLIIMAFTVGIAGNRLIDDFVGSNLINHEGHEKYEEVFAKWAAEDSTRLQSLKLAEFTDSDASETAQKYFERHKSFMRVLRGAAFAAFLLLLSMLLYQFARAIKTLAPCSRYSLSHYLLAIAMLIFFSVAYVQESTHYYQRVCELYTHVPKCKFK
jgi:hypothetical protein